MERRAGLSRHSVRKHLLSTFNKDDAQHPKPKKLDEVAIDAPPLASSDEGSDNDTVDGAGSGDVEADSSGRQGAVVQQDDSSDDTSSNRGDIKPTRFQRYAQSKPKPRTSARSSRYNSVDKHRSEGGLPTPASSAKSGASGVINDHSHTGNANLRKPVTMKFGTKEKVKRERVERFKKVPMDQFDDSDESLPKFKRPSPSLSPDLSRHRFKKLPSAVESSPEKSFIVPKFRLVPEESDDELGLRSEPKSGFKRLLEEDDDVNEPNPEENVRIGKSKRRAVQSKGNSATSGHLDDTLGVPSGDENEKPRTKFSDEQLDQLLNPGKELNLKLTAAEDATCPLCKEIVDADMLRSFSRGRWMSLRTQEVFCNAHQKKTAKEVWNARGYPTIDWDQLEERLGGYEPEFTKLLNGGSSHYGSILDKHVRTGKERTLLKSQHMIGPGYYGPRGFHAIQEHIIKAYSSLLRKRAVEDRLVSARGYGHFIQAVLIPEIVSLMIAEDMDASIKEARIIMEESVRIGELLNEDVGDTITTRTTENEA